MKATSVLQPFVIALATSISNCSAAPTAAKSSDAIAQPADLTDTVGGYKSVAYFTAWSIFEREYNVWDAPASKLTHLIYAFAQVASNGTVYYPGDQYADVSRVFTGHDSGYDGDGNLHGNVNQLFKIKKANRNLKTILSIGGWGEKNFPQAARTPQSREVFATTAVELMKDGGFDGIDIDWEFPEDDEEGRNFALLLEMVRNTLDQYAVQHASGHHFLLTVASPAAPSTHMPLTDMDQYLDFWNVMTYDFSGSWDTTARHQANLYPSASFPDSTSYAADTGLTDYIARGIPVHKLVMGIPVYGHSFAGTDGLGQPFTGPSPTASHCWEAGSCDYKVLPKAGAEEIYDPAIGASYSYDPITKEFTTYDSASVVIQKGEYIKAKGLGGAMFWETSADKTGADSLIGTLFDTLGQDLEQTRNWLSYPESRYKNVKSGMQGE
ncbi:Complement-fixation antigen [Hyphodiscus hymeniophilus]|uniref:chitinase n=1 Tax=Hyphodiscus hymeniophilus TaxID=353542 RepID=A0A9P6VDC8_9HELO|nr:Complement-fixation antigen [Hyphodiscus hymeniophilus]